MELSDLFSTLKRYCKKLKNVKLAYLFGSSLKRKNFEDIDIAVLFDEKIPKQKYAQLQLKLTGEIIDLLKFNNVDVIILNNLEDYLLAYQIVTKGIVLYKKDRFVDKRFKAKVLSLYPDFMYFLEKQFQPVQKVYGR